MPIPASIRAIDSRYFGRSTNRAGDHSPRVRPSISAPSSPITPSPRASYQNPLGPRMTSARSPGFAGIFPAKSVKYRTVGDVNPDMSGRNMAQILHGRA